MKNDSSAKFKSYTTTCREIFWRVCEKIVFVSLGFSILLSTDSAFARKEELDLEPIRTADQELELAFSRIVVGELKGNFSAIVQKELCLDLAEELALRTYWDAQCSMVTQIGNNPPVNGSDAVLIGEWRGSEVVLSLRSKRIKYELGRWVAPITPPEEAIVRPAAQALVDFLVSKIQMLGVVLKSRNGEILINVGSRKALRAGQRFRAFEYTGLEEPLNGKTLDFAIVEIKEILGKEMSVAKVVNYLNDQSGIPARAKIRIDDSTIIKSTPEKRMGDNPWFALGGEVLSIKTSLDNIQAVQLRNYNFNYTPFVDISFGNRIGMAHIIYGSAAAPDASISYLELEASGDVIKFEIQDNAYVIGALGLNVSQFSANNKISPPDYEDSQRIAPLLDLRYQVEPRPRFLFMVGSEFLFPEFTSGQDSGSQVFSYGIQPYVGGRYTFSAHTAAEIAGRFRYTSINFNGSNGLRENQTGYSARFIFSFN